MDNIRQRTLSGLGWNGATKILGAVLHFGISVILARLLSPRDFGLMGMVLVLTGFASNISEMGLGAALIQKRTVSDLHLNTVFWLNVAAGIFLTFFFCLTAPLVARFYDEPALYSVTAVVGLNLFLASLNVVQNALLIKSLNFRIKFWIESISLLISGTVGITLAFSGAGVWSLVGQSMASSAMQVGVMWQLSSWRPRFSFDLSAVKELLHFGGNLMGASILHYWGRNVDKLLIGRLLGSPALGLYALADKLMRLPISNVTDLTSAVMFPALSAMQDDMESIRRTYLRATRMIALLTFPMMIGLAVLAEPVVLAVYGDKWREAVSIVQVLCFSGLAQSIYFTGGWLFLSQGRTELVFRWSIYTTFVRVVGVFIAYPWGLISVAWAYVLSTYVLICFPAWSCAGRLVGIGLKALVVNVAGPFGCAVSMGLLVWILDHWIFSDHVPWIRLVIHVPLGISAYLFLIRRFRLEAVMDLRKLLIQRSGRRNRFLLWVVGKKSQATT